MRYQAYENQKKCNHPWIIKLPKHWDLVKLKYMAICQPSNVDKKTKDGEEYIHLCNYTDVFYNDEIISDMKFMKASATSEQIKKFSLYKDDVIITKDSEDPNDIAISAVVSENLDGVICGYHLAMIRAKKSNYGRYLKRVFDSTYARSMFASTCNGMTRYGLGTYAINNALFPRPSIKEQTQIATFLDRETQKIDRLIEKQQQLIKLLQEKRQAVISHAVTKGLNLLAKMKGSGVEWLGEIPGHWDVKSLRFLGACQNGINIGAEYFGSGYPFISYGDVYNNRVLPLVGSGLVQSSELDRARYSVKSGDVFFTRTSETIDEIGFSSACLSDIEDATFAGFLIRFRPTTNILSTEFSKHYFGNILLRAFFVKEMNLVTRASLSQDLLKKLPVVIPPINEQLEIGNYLDTKLSTIDMLVKKAKCAISLIKERRTALISAAVTGKIDVRNIADNCVSNRLETELDQVAG